MIGKIQIRKRSVGVVRLNAAKVVAYLFLFFAMCPFLFPTGLIGSDMQPYAAVFGVLLCVFFMPITLQKLRTSPVFTVLCLCSLAALIALVLSGVSAQNFRGAFNHLSVLIIPLATCVMLTRLGELPERAMKNLILFWFVVATVQMFIMPSFLTGIVAGARGYTGNRGVAGLASEPSFLGIICCYFLFLAKNFQVNRLRYMLMITVMGAVYAQSLMGIVFVAAFWGLYYLEHFFSAKGIFMLFGLAVAAVVGLVLLYRFGRGTRLYELVDSILNQGLNDTVDNDVSATVRYNTLVGALEAIVEYRMLPQGFDLRIGSGFGGLIIETGIFGLVECIIVAWGLAKSFVRIHTRIIGFAAVTLLLFMNTHISNPPLLMILGYTLWKETYKPNEKALEDDNPV